MKTITNFVYPFRKWLFNCLAALLPLLFCTALTPYQANPEYKVKSVFLYNFTQFIQWPEDSFSGQDSPFVIGILGPDPFGAYIDQTVEGETINGTPIVVKRYNNPEEALGCHILFIKEKDQAKLGNILKKLEERSILTVSDANGFAHMGGVIEFTLKESKIGLKVNPDAAKKQKLEISAKLLQLAEIVEH